MRRLPLAMIGLGFVLAAVGSVNAAKASPPAGQLLVFLPEGVDWIALPVEGHDLVASRTEFGRRVFESRDRDHNHHLTEAEARKLLIWSTEQGRLQLLGSVWKSADVAPQDGQLSLGEWQTHVTRAFGPEFRVLVDNRGTRRAGVLFSLIDQNRDGRLTNAELEQGAARLLRCDFDDDELVSLSELAELRSMSGPHATAEFESEPFLLLDSDTAIAWAVREIEARFRSAGSSGVPLTRIAGISAASDSNGDGVLDSMELEQVLRSPPVAAQLRITMQDSRGGVRWLADRKEKRSLSPRRHESVDLPGLKFDAKYLNTSLLNQLQRQELMTQFRDADRDNNDYLSNTEFAEFVSVLDENLAPDPAMADLDGNKQITRDEITLFHELRELATHCQVQLTVKREMKSLFDALDQDKNQGVSGWEIHAGSERFSALDRNQDGSVAVTELTGDLSLLIGFASTRREETAMTAVRARSPKAPPRKTSTQGPIWFQRMDRNQDQRISWREFLGTREQFQSLDQNQDGSLEVAEAK